MKQRCYIKSISYNEDIKSADQDIAYLIDKGWVVKSIAASDRAIVILLEKEE